MPPSIMEYGADGIRTRDLLTASQAFSQLNYGPDRLRGGIISELRIEVKME